MRTSSEVSDVFEHDAYEGDEVKVGEGLRASLVVFDQPSEACGPREESLDDPSPWEQREASFGLRPLYDLKGNAVSAAAVAGLSPV